MHSHSQGAPVSVGERTAELVGIPDGPVVLEGILAVPERADGIVIFAHGSGSSRHSPRNRAVAGRLREAGIGTLLLDLLSPGEEAGEEARFDIGLLCHRLKVSTLWLRGRPSVRRMAVGYFGASTGAAAALRAAAEFGPMVRAIVCRGGRPDLVPAADLARVVAPTLLIVGGRDPIVAELNEKAFAGLGGEKEFSIVAGATHLFEEKGALDEVGDLAARWFRRHLGTQRSGME